MWPGQASCLLMFPTLGPSGHLVSSLKLKTHTLTSPPNTPRHSGARLVSRLRAQAGRLREPGSNPSCAPYSAHDLG